MTAGGDLDTLSLLHFNGADAATTFPDVSGRVWTPAVNAQLDTAQKKFGLSSLYLDGASYIDTPTTQDLYRRYFPLTIEFFVRPDGLQAGSYPTILCNDTAWNTGTLSIRYDNTGKDKKFGVWLNPSDPLFVGATQFDPDVWYHIAVVRNGTTMKLYVDGSEDGSVAISSTLVVDLGKSVLRLGYGQWDGANGYFKGWVDELRISSVARYTGAFTPPAFEFGNEKNFLINRRDRFRRIGISLG